jgi:hypothetical protein
MLTIHTTLATNPLFRPLLTIPVKYGMADKPTSDDKTDDQLKQGDKDIIDKTLEELNVSTTSSGKDQTSKPDTEGSNSSSKNLDEQDD